MAIGDLGLDPTVQICPLELLLQRLISEHLLPIQRLTEFPYEIRRLSVSSLMQTPPGREKPTVQIFLLYRSDGS